MNMREAGQTVLFVYPYLPHYRYGVFKELENSGLIATFAADSNSHNSIDVVPFDALKRVISLRNHRFGRLLWQSGLLRHIFSTHYDSYVFVGDPTVLNYWPALALLRLKGVSTYLWTIGWHRPEQGIKKWIRISFYRLANEVMLYGHVGREIGASLGFPEHRMHVIGNSAVSSVTKELSQRNEAVERVSSELIGSQVPIVGAVIRLTPQKSLEMLIDAAAVLRSRGTEIVVLLAGDGPCHGALAKHASSSGVDLRLVGAVYAPQDLQMIYDLLDVTAVPRAVGLTGVQSMAHGTPVVSDDDVYSQMPEWEAIRPGLTGSVYTAGDVDALADAIEVWIQRDADAIIQTAIACRQEAKSNWNSASHAGKILSVLRKDHGRI